MIDPQTATDEEVDAWLAEHCGRLSEPSGECIVFGERWISKERFHPTVEYQQLVMCEAKVRDRWWLYGQSPTFKYGVDFIGFAAKEGKIIHAGGYTDESKHSVLSARARLVVAILQWEAKHRQTIDACRRFKEENPEEYRCNEERGRSGYYPEADYDPTDSE